MIYLENPDPLARAIESGATADHDAEVHGNHDIDILRMYRELLRLPKTTNNKTSHCPAVIETESDD